jgi:hypothetical protein
VLSNCLKLGRIIAKSAEEGEGEEEGKRRLTKEEAVKLGLTPGSRFFRFITGKSDE